MEGALGIFGGVWRHCCACNGDHAVGPCSVFIVECIVRNASTPVNKRRSIEKDYNAKES